MIGLTGLVDTQLASKLSQRLDLLALKAEVQIDGPGPVIQVEKVVNNVGLFSRAALSAALIRCQISRMLSVQKSRITYRYYS